jgi:hypothetical protein
MSLHAARQVNAVVRRKNRLVTIMFVPDTDPELRSLLTACQAADDASAPMTALASWLDRRHDPRGPLVRLGIRFWNATRREPPEDLDPAEFDELETRMLYEEGDPVLADWLGLCGRGDSAGVCWHKPLLEVCVSDTFDAMPVRVLPVIRAGWVWQLALVGPRVDEALATLLAEPGPIRELSFSGNPSLRDGDLEALAGIPHLRQVDLSRTRITDRGLRHLHRIRTLRLVRLEYTPRVTRAGIAALQEALPACAVQGL